KMKFKIESERESIEAKFSISDGQHSPEEIVLMLQEYIKNNFADDINFNLIAQKFSYSSSYLSRLFAQHTGQSPSKYLMDIRINRAKYLLQNYKTLSIKQIGESVGYLDQSYFSRVFKKVTGLSPLDFR